MHTFTGIEKSLSKHSWRAFILGFLTIFLLGTTFLQASSVENENTGAEFNNLQEAINAANPGDTLKIKGTFYGNFVINKSLNLLGKHATLDGAHAGTVLTILGSPVVPTIVGLYHLKIRNGAGGTDGGGGILNVIGNLILNHVKVVHNQAIGNGGGIRNATPVGSPVFATISLDSCKIKANTSAANGGGISNEGAAMRMTHSIVLGNLADNGGGILSIASANAITDSTIEANAALLQGGGIEHIVGSASTLTNVVIKHNHAGQAGGVFNGGIPLTVLDPSAITFNDCKFHGNNSFTVAGGFFNDTNSAASFTNSDVSRNEALNFGGGIFNNVGALLNLTDTEVEDNIPDNIVDL